MSYIVYILYSSQIDKYYVGFTGNTIVERLRKHNSNHKGFTGRANDWVDVHIEEYENKSSANARELSIKKRKSRNYIENLIKSEV